MNVNQMSLETMLHLLQHSSAAETSSTSSSHGSPFTFSDFATMSREASSVKSSSSSAPMMDSDGACNASPAMTQHGGGQPLAHPSLTASGGVLHEILARRTQQLNERHRLMEKGCEAAAGMDLSTMTMTPSATAGSIKSGKKRVLCDECCKSFCDKGALKIHKSAVHRKEMHECLVSGCDKRFSSRRSRNRHSNNPNPNLHTPKGARSNRCADVMHGPHSEEDDFVEEGEVEGEDDECDGEMPTMLDGQLGENNNEMKITPVKPTPQRSVLPPSNSRKRRWSRSMNMPDQLASLLAAQSANQHSASFSKVVQQQLAQSGNPMDILAQFLASQQQFHTMPMPQSMPPNNVKLDAKVELQEGPLDLSRGTPTKPQTEINNYNNSSMVMIAPVRMPDGSMTTNLRLVTNMLRSAEQAQFPSDVTTSASGDDDATTQDNCQTSTQVDIRQVNYVERRTAMGTIAYPQSTSDPSVCVLCTERSTNSAACREHYEQQHLRLKHSCVVGGCGLRFVHGTSVTQHHRIANDAAHEAFRQQGPGSIDSSNGTSSPSTSVGHPPLNGKPALTVLQQHFPLKAPTQPSTNERRASHPSGPMSMQQHNAAMMTAALLQLMNQQALQRQQHGSR